MDACSKCRRTIRVGERRFRAGGYAECSECFTPLREKWEEVVMPDEVQKPNPQKGPIVEDTQMVGGIDKTTGAPVIRPKTADGKADNLTEATDPNEKSAE